MIMSFKFEAKLVSIFILLIIIVDGSDDLRLLIENISRELELRLTGLVNSSLEIQSLGNIYETKTRLVKREYDPNSTLLNFVGNISERLDGVIDILKINKHYIEESYSNNTGDIDINITCCNGPNTQYYDVRFNLISSYQTCFCNQQKKVTLNINKNIDDLYRKNLVDSSILLWQYFGDSEGIYHQYPSKPRFCSSPDQIDHRFQDWYVFTASRQKKNVVIVVDESGSMSIPSGGFKNPNTTLRVVMAREAAITVLETLSPSDHVGVVAFSNEPRSPLGCLGSKVNKATMENKKSLRDFLQNIKPKKDTYYGKAFRSAFSLLKEAKLQTPDQFENSLDMILFLTDGTPSESKVNDILEEIAIGQNNMNNSVQIFVYGFGREILNSKFKNKTDLLLKIADQNNRNMTSMFGIPGGSNLQWPKLHNLPDNSKPVGPTGNLTILPDVDKEQLRHVIGSYYTKFPLSQCTDYTVSLPHVEDNLGLVITLGIPTLNRVGNFFGVAAIDLSLELTFYEVVHFRQGQHSYGFIVGHEGKVLVHPYMTDPHQHWTQPRFYNINQIEPMLSVETVYNITNGIPGVFHSGVASYWRSAETPSQGTKPATFYYEPVLNFHGNYTAVLVIFDEDIEVLEADEDVEKGDFPEFVYHRIDLYDNETLTSSNICIRDDSFVLQNNATIKFAPNVYSNPLKSLQCEQNKNQSCPVYQHYRNARLFSQNADIHQDASNDVVLTNITDQLWQMDDITWRYLGTENGFFKIFPGTMLSDVQYDPRDDLWYRKSYDNPDKYMFIDEGENSTYVTMAKVFHKTSNGSVSGVAAADISRRQFSVILKNLLTTCTHCYILDGTGYVLEQWDSTKNFQKKHITEIAGPVSFLLMKKGFLKPEICMDATSSKKILSYTLNLGGRSSVVEQIGCHDYILTSINNTNLFLLRYQPDSCPSLVGTCSCRDTCILCDEKMDSMCQCPCACINKTIDGCGSNFTVAQGYIPCKDRERHWKTVKNLKLERSNITKCQPQCPLLQNQNDCRNMSGCVWCTTGSYTYIPMCTQNCVVDRVEINLNAPCSNLSDYNTRSLVKVLQRSVKMMISDTNVNIGLPVIVQQDISLNISTKDGTSVPDRWTDILSKPVYINITDSIVLINDKHIDGYLSVIVTLTYNKVNFTNDLEKEWTLREYIEKQIEELALKLLNDGSLLVSEIWPEQDQISFLITASSRKTDWLRQVMSWNTSALPVIDVFGRPIDLLNVSFDTNYHSLCDVPCMKMLNQFECNRVPGCHWDIFSHGLCTNNSFLPERIQTTIYLPCLGLYNNMTAAENEIIRNFQQMLITHIPSLDQAMLQPHIIKDDALIGRQIWFQLQGRVTSPPITDIWWDIQQLIGQDFKTPIAINGSEYHMTLHPTTYQQFTNMHITLRMEGLDLDTLLQQHPLDGREEIRNGITGMVQSYLRPQVVRTLGNLKLTMDEVTFSVDSYHDNRIDLRSEYDMLQTAVSNGNVSMVVYGQRYAVEDIVFIGTFDQICPRNCYQGTQSTCDSIPGCDWSDLNQCSSDVIYPERVNVTVVYPCVDIDNITDSERNQILSETQKHLTDYFRTRTTSNVIAAVNVEQGQVNGISVTLQASSTPPPLITLYSDVVQWLKDNKLHIKVDNSSVIGVSQLDFARMSVALEFTHINFTTETLDNRKTVIQTLINQIRLVLSEGVGIENVWLTLNYSVFEITRLDNRSQTVDLNKDIDKIRKFIQLGGLRLNLNGYTIIPRNIRSHGYINCQHCELSNGSTECRLEKPCFWMGEWDSSFCSYKNHDKFKYKIFLPCNQTQILTKKKEKESLKSLYNNVLQLLHPAGQYIISYPVFIETGATIEIQTTPLYPYLERYTDMLIQEIDYKTGFNFGPQNLIPRCIDDFTNIQIKLHFKSIDFDAIVNSGLSSYKQISILLQRQINSLVLGEIGQSYQLMTIEKDYIQFSLKKDASSHVDMSGEITILKTLVNDRVLVIDINYIRPVIATAISISGTFDGLCQSLAGQVTVPTFSTVPSFTSNATKPKIPTAMIPIPFITIIYNKSTASRQNIHSVIDTTYVDVCFLEIHHCPMCSSFSTQTCGFKGISSHERTHSVFPDDVGPVQWTIISIGGIFILALAVWAIQGIHEMAKKKKPPGQNTTRACSIEDTE